MRTDWSDQRRLCIFNRHFAEQAALCRPALGCRSRMGCASISAPTSSFRGGFWVREEALSEPEFRLIKSQLRNQRGRLLGLAARERMFQKGID